jgi:hypothetical protein
LGYINRHIGGPAKTLNRHRRSVSISNGVERFPAVPSILLEHGYAVDGNHEITSMQTGVRERRAVFAGVDVESAHEA